MQTLIREATEADLPGVLRLYGQLEAEPEQTLSLPEARAILARMRSYPDYRLYVAEADGRLAGTFALAIMDNLGHLGAPSGLIEDVVVDEKLRGKGLGKAMMRYAIGLCKVKGCYKAVLSSNLHREQAHRFYESLGFIKHGYSFYMELEGLKEV